MIKGRRVTGIIVKIVEIKKLFKEEQFYKNKKGIKFKSQLLKKVVFVVKLLKMLNSSTKIDPIMMDIVCIAKRAGHSF
jgi:hypothetical protein